MISQRCPKCSSSRVRAGYRPTPLWSKLLFRFNLLCNNCNWEFRGFAVPGTVSSNPRRSKKKPSEFVPTSEKNDAENIVKNKVSFPDSKKVSTKKRIKINS